MENNLDKLLRAARNVVLWRSGDEDFLDSLSDYEAVHEKRFNEDEVIYKPLREALAAFNR